MGRLWVGILKPRSWLAALLLLVLIVATYYFSQTAYYASVREFLDSDAASFTIGDTRISAILAIKAAIAAIILIWAAGILSRFGERRIASIEGVRTSNKVLITKAFQFVIYFFAFIIGLEILGIELTILAIFGGAVGIGIGFGLQKIAANFISGLILLIEKSVEIGDLVELADGTFGYIRHLGARYILIECFDGKEIMIPNEDLITTSVTNWTYSNSRARVEVPIGISYRSDIEKAMQLMLEAANENSLSLGEPKPVCYLREFADSSINLLLYFWIDDVTSGRFEPQSDVMRSIWKKFGDNDIEIPFPQRDVHIKHAEVMQ